MPPTIDAILITDPFCPWAYSAEPALSTLRWRYGDQLRWRLVTIGLSERAETLVERGRTPLGSAAGVLGFRRFGMPLSPAPRARVHASARACRAIVAARLSAPGSEWEVYRALQWAVFTTDLLLDDDDGLLEALAGVRQVDARAVVAALDEPAVSEAYQADRAEARTATGSAAELQGKTAQSDGPVRYTAPTLVLERAGRRLVAGGHQPLAAYDVLIANLDPGLSRRPPIRSSSCGRPRSGSPRRRSPRRWPPATTSPIAPPPSARCSPRSPPVTRPARRWATTRSGRPRDRGRMAPPDDEERPLPMRRLLATCGLLTALLFTASAGAITNGTVDGNRHPEVGGLVAASAYSDGTWLYCSGTLISPTVFLTAAHCADERSRIGVSFDPVYRAGISAVHWGAYHADPGYSQRQSDPRDLAVVIFDRPVTGITPARLPAAHSLDGLPHGTPFTSVGYGAYQVTSGGGAHRYLYDDVRMVATGTLNSVTPSWLRISMNPSTGNGGTCYGDSGGPNFLGAGASETNILAGTTITGDAVCRATNVDYRLDTASARAFLRPYVALP